ncbi:MAG: hypothetical protein EXS05_05535, partial [Planctomycetaceae bacterium]|nr:hypothetical protein [Planctomycetaceae bacterium]
MTIIKGDLGIVKINGSEVPEQNEQSPGGFVPVNNDDDDYDGTADILNIGKVNGEHDLVQMNVHLGDPGIAGIYTLSTTSPTIRIWGNADKSSPRMADANNPLEIIFTQSRPTETFYVEGLTIGAAQASEQIQLKWTAAQGSMTRVLDTVYFTVYEVKGPQNVPDYSTHLYTGDVPGGGYKESWTLTARGKDGKLIGGTNNKVIGDTATIHWGGGAYVGKAVFTPWPGFEMEWNVNVVRVDIVTLTKGAATTPGKPFFFKNDNDGFVYVFSGKINGLGVEGIFMASEVTLTGPTANGVNQRGVTHIQVGFVQNVTIDTSLGLYSDLTSLSQNSIIGQTYLDASPGEVYYSDDPSSVLKPIDAANRTKIIAIVDTPAGKAPLINGSAKLTLVVTVYNFTTYIVAQTDDTANDAADVFTSRAVVDWKLAVDEVVSLT